MDYDVLSHKPDIMFFMGGLNDIWHTNETIEQYQENIENIIDKAQKNKIEVILLNLTIFSEDINEPKNKKIAQYNGILEKIAKEKKVQLIDVNKSFWEEIGKHDKTGRILTVSDGVHLNEKGNEVLAEKVIRDFSETHKPYRLLSANKSTKK